MANFIKEALDKVFTEGNEFPSVTYEAPPAVVKYMEMQIAIGNPPWKKKKGKVKKIDYICNVLLNGVAGIQKEIGTNHCSNPLPTDCYLLAFFL